MADPARPWQILLATADRLRTISVANGYRTDVGADVRTEPSRFEPEDGPRITLYTGGVVRPDDARSRGEREFGFVVEALMPVALANAQELVTAAAEDIEDALLDPLPLPEALPLTFEESLFLERPDGVPCMAAQLMFRTRFRR